MSTLRVDRIEPYLSSSVSIEGAIQANAATTGSNTFVGDQNIQGTITASIQEGFALVGGVGDVSTLVATSSFGGVVDTSSLATTGSNTFNGDQLINGVSTQTFTAPADNTQNNIAVVNGANIDGQAYTNVFFGMQDYGGSGDQYKDAWVYDYWTDFTYATGSEFIVNPKRIGGTMALSGSGNASLGISQLRDLGGKTFLNQYANIINLGSFAPATTDEIVIGHNTLPVLRLSSANTEMTGSVTISGSAANDLIVEGRQLITGPTTGQTPQLLISSSDSNTLVTRDNFVQTIPGAWNVGIRANTGFEHGKVSNGDYIGVLADNASYGNTGWAGPGISGNDPTDSYPVLIGFQSKSNWTDGTVTILKPLDVSGSVNITDVIQLAGLDPLPAGAEGQLANSGSNLYFFSGSAWKQIAFV
jgi:hypothetical protein